MESGGAPPERGRPQTMQEMFRLQNDVSEWLEDEDASNSLKVVRAAVRSGAPAGYKSALATRERVNATYIQSPARKLVFGLGGLLEMVYGGSLCMFGQGGA